MVLVRATLVIAAIVLGLTGMAAADCPPSASVSGEPDVVESVDRLLRERGVVVLERVGEDAAFPVETCRHVVVTVMRGGGRIAVWITDPDGQRVERLTEDPIAAATIIESWARRDLVSPLLATRRTPVVGDTSVQAAAVAPSEPGSRYTLLVGVDAGVSNDRSMWTAVRAQGCVRVGGVCIGGIIRYAYDTAQTGASRRWDTGRTGLDLSVTVGVPLAWRRISVMPYGGFGQMAITATRALDVSDPMPTREREQASAMHVLVGGSAHVHVSPRWSVRVDLAAHLAPFADEALGDPTDDALLPASPRLQAWFGIALAYGGL